MLRAMSRPRRNRVCLVALAVLLGGCGSSAAQTQPSNATGTGTVSGGGGSGPSPGSASVCGPAGARTLAADARARVFVASGHVVGCAHGGGTYVLGRSTSCLGGALAGPVALSGVRVAVALKRCGVDTGRSQVQVRRLDNGQVIGGQAATTSPLGAESYVTVSSIALARNGAVAWITEAASIVSHRRAIQVHASGPAGTRILDSGPGIGPRSLRLSGTVLRWRDEGRVRTARLG